MEPARDLERRISGIAALDQPLRRDLYRLLSDRGGWVTRDEASEALGVPRSVAAFHLDKLEEAGVVEVTFARTSGRQGPGAGRPAKLYRRSDTEVSASVPDRRYDLASRAARRSAVLDVLTRHGYEPTMVDPGEIALVNCPFHRLAEEHRNLVCGMNLELLTGVLDGMGAPERSDARLAPEPGYCCVRITAA